MKASFKFAAMPSLTHIALSLFAIVGLLMFDATSNADVIDQSQVEYATLQKTMAKVGVTYPNR